MTDNESFVSEDNRRQRLILFSVAFASFMVNVDTYIVNYLSSPQSPTPSVPLQAMYRGSFCRTSSLLQAF